MAVDGQDARDRPVEGCYAATGKQPARNPGSAHNAMTARRIATGRTNERTDHWGRHRERDAKEQPGPTKLQ